MSQAIRHNPLLAALLPAAASLLAACASAAATEPAPSPTPTAAAPARLLFIGDSFTYYNLGVDAHLRGLAATADPPLGLTTASVTLGNTLLSQHWELGLAQEQLRKGPWDLVVLQEDSSLWTRGDDRDKERFFESVRRFDGEIRKRGARTVLYMPWEYQDVQIPIAEIAAAYDRIGAELGIPVAPVGLAWKRAAAEQPEIPLYDADRTHPSIQGTYLSVCVLYATIFASSPEGLPYQPADAVRSIEAMRYKAKEWTLTPGELSALQKIAWDVVRNRADG